MCKSQLPAALAAKTTSCLILLGVLVAVSGCGNKKPYSCVNVSGKVTYDDDSLIPADQIRLTFLSQTPPIDPRTPPHNGVAKADGKTGQFDSATTFLPKDGIIVGDHKVIVQCIKNGHEAKELVPPEYCDREKTPLKANSNQSPFDFKIPKPGRHRG